MKKLIPWLFACALFALILLYFITYAKELEQQADEKKRIDRENWHVSKPTKEF